MTLGKRIFLSTRIRLHSINVTTKIRGAKGNLKENFNPDLIHNDVNTNVSKIKETMVLVPFFYNFFFFFLYWG